MTKGNQCTISWHVDNIKMSHVDADVVTEIINKIQLEFGKEFPISVTRGKKGVVRYGAGFFVHKSESTRHG